MNSRKQKKLAIYPAFSQNEVMVLIGASEFFVPYVGVLLRSIVDNSSTKNNYDIVLLSDEISLESQSQLKNLAFLNRGNFSFRIFDIGMYLQGYAFHTRSYISRTSCARLLIPEFTLGVEKAIWLDSDTIVDCDIADLYFEELGDCYIAAVRDIGVQIWRNENNWTPEELYSVLGLRMDDYFNAGVILLNLKLLRENFTYEQMLKAADRPDIHMIDQDALNWLCLGKVKYLSAAWNVLVTSYLSKNIPEKYQKEIHLACQKPNIIHYVGEKKPADNLSLPFYEYFWKYARLTPFYEPLLQRFIQTQFTLVKGNLDATRILISEKSKVKSFLKIIKQQVHALK